MTTRSFVWVRERVRAGEDVLLYLTPEEAYWFHEVEKQRSNVQAAALDEYTREGLLALLDRYPLQLREGPGRRPDPDNLLLRQVALEVQEGQENWLRNSNPRRRRNVPTDVTGRMIHRELERVGMAVNDVNVNAVKGWLRQPRRLQRLTTWPSD
jgi:hypothetical protein